MHCSKLLNLVPTNDSKIYWLHRYCRVKSFESIEQVSEKKVLMKLLECSAEVTRNLSPWCKALPLIDVSVLLDTIYVSNCISVINCVFYLINYRFISLPTFIMPLWESWTLLKYSVFPPPAVTVTQRMTKKVTYVTIKSISYRS